ncbi:MAG: glycine cleavage system aminomethyltransferase GcvT [Candidatus Omnitrophica bacterium]|nr:glycine cleavage system aminomethyltransferase GcvT [Candidatus Omnitrophota bacterium]
MSAPSEANVRSLPLQNRHVAAGARFGTFGNWNVPLYYTGILEEHKAVRTHAGLFDISHMGEFFFKGSGAARFLNELLPRDIENQKLGRAFYMPLLREDGGIIDDIIVYRFTADEFLMIVNAGNIEKDFTWIKPRVPVGVALTNASEELGLLALQGPASEEIAAKIFPEVKLKEAAYYGFLLWKNGMIARTGYTGEHGFEIMAPHQELAKVWDDILDIGAQHAVPRKVISCGFGARDTLRLEAGMPLYGHDMNDEITPLEAGLEWAVDLKKKSFVGREALGMQMQSGLKKKLVGFEMIERGIPRQGQVILKNGKKAGEVTSGSFAPTLERNIGLGYVAAELAVPGEELEVVIREKLLRAKIVKLPFYKRKS